MKLYALIGIALLALGCGKGEEAKSNENPSEAQKNASQDKAEPTKGEPTKAEPSKAPEVPMATSKLDGIGFEMSAPSDWQFKKLNESAYRFRIKPSKRPDGSMIMASVSVVKTPMGPKTVDDVAKRCSGQLLKKGEANGAVFQHCEMETAGQKYNQADYVYPDGEAFVICKASGLSTELMAKVCGSLKKK